MKKLAWCNPRRIDMGVPFVYGIFITTTDGEKYKYVGRATTGADRVKRYGKNIENMYNGDQPCSGGDDFRPIHYALENDWKIEFFPLKNRSTVDAVKASEKKYKARLKCNLNDRQGRETVKALQIRLKALT